VDDPNWRKDKDTADPKPQYHMQLVGQDGKLVRRRGVLFPSNKMQYTWMERGTKEQAYNNLIEWVGKAAANGRGVVDHIMSC